MTNLYYNVRKIKASNQLGFIDELRQSGIVIHDSMDMLQLNDGREIPFAIDYQRYTLFKQLNEQRHETGQGGFLAANVNDILLYEFEFSDTNLTIDDQYQICLKLKDFATIGDVNNEVSQIDEDIIYTKDENGQVIEQKSGTTTTYYYIGYEKDDKMDVYNYFGEVLLAIFEAESTGSRFYIVSSTLDIEEARVRTSMVMGGHSKEDSLHRVMAEYLSRFNPEVTLTLMNDSSK